MTTFTIPLKEVIDITGGTTVIGENGISVLTGGNIGLDYYPIFDEIYRPELTGKIVDHFWNREIGTESVDMFQLAMRRKMNEIMPYYNLLYLSTKITFDPLATIDMQTVTSGGSTQTSTTDATNETTNNADSHSRAVQSDTPQTMLQGNADYATGASDVNGTTDSTTNATENNTSNVDGTVNGTSSVTGFQGVASELLMRYRQSLINIDMMVISDLEELFMLIWDNGDSYTQSEGLYLL